REVAELRLPDDETVRAVEAVAVLEAEDAGLGERAVERLEMRRAVTQVGERVVALARVRVHEHGVPVTERAAPRVLSTEAHRRAAVDEAPVSGHFARRPPPGVGR